MKLKYKYAALAVAVLLCATAAVLSGIFLFSERIPVLLFLICGIVIGLLGWKAFSGNSKQKEVDSLKKTIKDLDRELAEKTQSRLNVVGLTPILHIAVLDVDTSFVRPYVRDNGSITFNGALRADLQVEYGIKLEDVLFRYDPMANSLTLANFHPGIISYSRKQLKWEFAKSYKSRSFLGRGLADVSDKDADKYTAKMCEKLRSELEKEIDTRKVSEFDWLSPLITNQVVDVLRLMAGRESLEVRIEDNADSAGFVRLEEFKRQVTPALIEEQ